MPFTEFQQPLLQLFFAKVKEVFISHGCPKTQKRPQRPAACWGLRGEVRAGHRARHGDGHLHPGNEPRCHLRKPERLQFQLRKLWQDSPACTCENIPAFGRLCLRSRQCGRRPGSHRRLPRLCQGVNQLRWRPVCALEGDRAVTRPPSALSSLSPASGPQTRLLFKMMDRIVFLLQ